MATTPFEDWIAKKNARRTKKSQPKQLQRKTPRVAKAKEISKDPVGTKVRSRKRPKKGFSKDVREAAHIRCENHCENPLCGRNVYELGGEHHCLPKSQYRGNDRNDLWNCSVPCTECHDRITSPRSVEDKRLRRYFERVAFSRKTYTGDILRRELDALEAALKSNELDLVRTFAPITVES